MYAGAVRLSATNVVVSIAVAGSEFPIVVVVEH